MTPDKKIKEHAKSLFKLCFEDGQFSDERARAVLQALDRNPPRNYSKVLKIFLQLVKREVAANTAVVEHAGALSPAVVDTLQVQLSQHFGRRITVETRRNEELIAGVRVRVGCDVFESSVASSLRELQKSLA